MTESPSGSASVDASRRSAGNPARGGALAAGLVVLIAAIAYLPLIGRLGFYRDDWFVIWSGNARGAWSLVQLFEIDRPVMGYLYALTYSIIGNSPLGWHVYAFMLRLIGALVFLRLTRILFPGETLATTSMAILFVIYPGFLQQPNANTFQNHFFSYAAGLTSILLTVLALKGRPRWQVLMLTALSMLFGLANLLIYEYMIGLEGLRIVLIWYVLRADSSRRFAEHAKQVFRRLTPYGALLSGFLFWRIVIFKSSRVATNLALVTSAYQDNPLRMGVIAVIETFKDLVETSVLGWFVPFYTLSESAAYRDLLSAVFLAGVACALVALYWRVVSRASSIPSNARRLDLSSATWIGGLGLLFAIVPVVLAQRDVRFASAFDRYTLHATAAVGLLVGGFVFAVLPRFARPPTLLFLVAISIITHFNNSLHWDDFWRDERQLWWQLSWRAPQIKAGSVLLVQIPSEGFREDYEIWGPANLVYSRGTSSIRIVAEILNEQIAQKVRFGSREVRGMRGLGFDRDFNKVLILSMPSQATCLHVLDKNRLEVPDSAGSLIYSIARYSNIDQIDAEQVGGDPPVEIFGLEPAHGWCYYYQLASLARQLRDWPRIAELADEVGSLGLRPSDRSEWLPFLEGYLNVGRVEDGQRIARLIRDKEPIRKTLCDRLPAGPQPESENYEEMLELLCEFG